MVEKCKERRVGGFKFFWAENLISADVRYVIEWLTIRIRPTSSHKLNLLTLLLWVDANGIYLYNSFKRVVSNS